MSIRLQRPRPVHNTQRYDHRTVPSSSELLSFYIRMSTRSNSEGDAPTNRVEEKEAIPKLPHIHHWIGLLIGKRLVEDDCSVHIPELRPTAIKQRPPTLLSMPTEVHLQIFQHVLAPPEPFRWSHSPFISITDHEDEFKSIGTRCAIIFTCRQLFLELAALAFRNNTFKRKDLPYHSWLNAYPHRFRDMEFFPNPNQGVYENTSKLYSR